MTKPVTFKAAGLQPQGVGHVISEAIMKNNHIKLLSVLVLCGWTLLSGCTSVNTFPAIARPGDTVSFMVGGSAQARMANVSATLTDASGQVFDLRALGLVRSVFNLRADGRAYGQHYSPYIDGNISWLFGHEPLQTMMVTDLPPTAAAGQATLSVAFSGVSDNSSGTGSAPFTVNFEIIPGIGASEQFKHLASNGDAPADFSRLETAPYARIGFAAGLTPIGAASLVIAFDNTVVSSTDLDLYVPESTVRDYTTNAFGKTQRMVYWRQDGQKLYVDIVAPQGIEPRYLQFFVVHPRGLTGSPAFSILSAQVYGTDGNAIAATPTLSYSP